MRGNESNNFGCRMTGIEVQVTGSALLDFINAVIETALFGTEELQHGSIVAEQTRFPTTETIHLVFILINTRYTASACLNSTSLRKPVSPLWKWPPGSGLDPRRI